MLNITVLCVGKMKERFYIDAAAEYQKRLSPFCRLTVAELPEERLPENPSPAQIDAALAKEADAVRTKLPPNVALIALCIEGQLLSSEQLAKRIRTWELGPFNRLVFLLGSSNGLHGSLKADAQLCLSMSPMTFPHHLARVMLLEQLYRCFSINNGGKYHK